MGRHLPLLVFPAPADDIIGARDRRALPINADCWLAHGPLRQLPITGLLYPVFWYLTVLCVRYKEGSRIGSSPNPGSEELKYPEASTLVWLVCGHPRWRWR